MKRERARAYRRHAAGKRFLKRRAFLAGAASCTVAPGLFSAAGANDRLRIGLIGAGGRGSTLMGQVADLRSSVNAEVCAVCDVWRVNLERAARTARSRFKTEVKTTTRFNELLSWRDVDAVIIATPDFGHSPILEAAAEAGKDAYVEKPMCYELKEARRARDAVLKHKRVVQVGTQRRSDGYHRSACQVIKNGVLGKVSRVSAAMNFNHARWLRDYRNCKEKDVDWEAYLFNRPKRPFDPRLLRRWHLFREFTNGISGLWMSHFVDAVAWIMDDPFPESAVANGGVFVWKEDRQTSDTFEALLTFPKEFLFSFAMGLGNSAGTHFTVHGTQGTLDLQRWVLSSEGGAGKGKIKQSKKLAPAASTHHMKSFLECVFSRKKPTAPIEAGWQHSVACVMAAKALWTGRRQRFDREKETLVPG